MQDDPEQLVRSIARAVIRKVAAEYPCSPASELRLRMSAANPFEDCDPFVFEIFEQEIEWAMRTHSVTVH